MSLYKLCCGPLLFNIGCRSLASQVTTGDNVRNVIGMRVEIPKEIQFQLRQEYESDPRIKRSLKGNADASRVFSIDFGDKNDIYNLKLHELYKTLLKFDEQKRTVQKNEWGTTDDIGVPVAKDKRVKQIALCHVKMDHLKGKMVYNPENLRGPQIKYHPHMEVMAERWLKIMKHRKDELVWIKGNYVKMKLAERARNLGNRYDSYYVWQREKVQHLRLTHSRNQFFYRYVYYDSESDVPVELHGKEAAMMDRWCDLREERDTLLREIELGDILKYRHVVNSLGITPIFVPTQKLPKPKWFRNHAISSLNSAEVARLRDKRKHGAVSRQEEEEVTIPGRPTQFSELIAGWSRADQNVKVDTDFHFGNPEPTRDPIPLVPAE